MSDVELCAELLFDEADVWDDQQHEHTVALDAACEEPLEARDEDQARDTSCQGRGSSLCLCQHGEMTVHLQ